MPSAPHAPDPFDLRRGAGWVLLTVWVALGLGAWMTTARTQTLSHTAEASTDPGGGYRIDLNRADPATLQLLPGVGPSIADNLVAHRKAQGPFTTPADLEAVHLIGPVLRDRIAPWVTFGPPPAAGSPKHPNDP